MGSSNIVKSELNELIVEILRAATNAKEGHVPSALSILDILYCLFLSKERQTNNLKLDFKFILSKGHASLALYAVLSKANFFSTDWVETFGKFDSNFGGHPDRNKVNGVLASTGSLGHGLPLGVGLSLANRALDLNEKVYVLIGDGELNEGSNWESLLISNHHHISNLVIVVDCNDSTNRAVKLDNLKMKLESFGVETAEIDGHNHDEIISALFVKNQISPRAILAKTIKGYGVSEMVNNPAWHHAAPTEAQFLSFVNAMTE
jgi:transketolase